MGKFIHTPENEIYINSSGPFSLTFFLTVEPAYALPAGATHQYYEQTVERWWANSRSQYFMATAWATGDGYIANEATYNSAHLTYLNDLITLEDAKNTRINEMLTYSASIKNGNYIYLGNQLFSDGSSLQNYIDEFIAYTSLGALPGSYYVNDVAYNQITVASLAELASIRDNIINLFYLSRINEDVHRAAIEALGTVVAVQSYDYTTGWEIVPYSPNTTFYAKYNSTIDATYSGGTGTGTATGGAAIANGVLDLAHDDVRYVSYDGTSNIDHQQTGFIRFLVKPNYSGTPTADKCFISIAKADQDDFNLIEIKHLNATGNVYINIKDQAGSDIVTASLAAWSPTSGTWYEFSLYYDISTGNTFLKIDNMLIGAVQTDTGIRSADIDLLRVGADYDSTSGIVSDFSIKELIITSA